MNPATESVQSDLPSSSAGAMSAPRLAQFEDEVSKLKVTGGGANPERLGAQWGIGLVIVGFVIALISWFSAMDATKQADIWRSQIMAAIGIGLAIVGIAIWVRNSITRYLRYWIIRLVYEQREQTDALIKALRDK
jgi:hypothetical protein